MQNIIFKKRFKEIGRKQINFLRWLKKHFFVFFRVDVARLLKLILLDWRHERNQKAGNRVVFRQINQKDFVEKQSFR